MADSNRLLIKAARVSQTCVCLCGMCDVNLMCAFVRPQTKLTEFHSFNMQTQELALSTSKPGCGCRAIFQSSDAPFTQPHQVPVPWGYCRDVVHDNRVMIQPDDWFQSDAAFPTAVVVRQNVLRIVCVITAVVHPMCCTAGRVYRTVWTVRGLGVFGH